MAKKKRNMICCFFWDTKCFFSRCESAFDPDGNSTYCYWDYSGQGIEYQVLAGPVFIVVMTSAGVLIGFFGDKVSR